MLTTPAKGTGLSAANVQAPMLTDSDRLTADRPKRPVSSRQAPVLSALLQGPQTREQIDRIAGASDGPDVVARLRRRIGLVIPVTLNTVRVRDGRNVERGIYALAASAPERAASFLLALSKGSTTE